MVFTKIFLSILGTSGTIKSYNYDGGYHLANQQYSNCIRTEAGYCSISYAAVSDTSFQISLIAPSTSAAIAQIGDSCTQDWIVIPGGGSTVLASTNSDRSDITHPIVRQVRHNTLNSQTGQT